MRRVRYAHHGCVKGYRGRPSPKSWRNLWSMRMRKSPRIAHPDLQTGYELFLPECKKESMQNVSRMQECKRSSNVTKKRKMQYLSTSRLYTKMTTFITLSKRSAKLADSPVNVERHESTLRTTPNAKLRYRRSLDRVESAECQSPPSDCTIRPEAGGRVSKSTFPLARKNMPWFMKSSIKMRASKPNATKLAMLPAKNRVREHALFLLRERSGGVIGALS